MAVVRNEVAHYAAGVEPPDEWERDTENGGQIRGTDEPATPSGECWQDDSTPCQHQMGLHRAFVVVLCGCK
jgi:hypothetical protein